MWCNHKALAQKNIMTLYTCTVGMTFTKSWSILWLRWIIVIGHMKLEVSMAGRRGRRCSQTGSDAVFDIICTPCGDDGSQEEAVQFCPNCQEYLCSACTKCHQRMKATRDHVLVGARQAKQNPSAARSVIEEKCWYHPDRNIEMYCETHNMVYCARCIATEHRSCRGVTDINHATKDDYSLSTIQSLESDINSIHEKLVNVSKKKEKILAETKEQQTNILGRIKDMKKKLVDHLENLETAATDAVKKKCGEIKNEVEEDITSLSKMIGKVEERKKKLNQAGQMNKGQKFVQVKLGQKAAEEGTKFCNEKALKQHENVTFAEDEELSDAVMKKQAFGQINTVEAKKELEIRTVNMEVDEDDCTICLIPDLCQLNDGSIYLVDQRNKCLKKLDENYKKAIRICGFNAEPTGICCTGNNEVAVKLKSDKVVFLIVTDFSYRELTKKVIEIEDGGSWGIAYFAGDLWVSFRDGVRVYSMSGILKEVITHVHDQFGGITALSPVHMAVRKKLIFLANGEDGVLCLDKDGLLKYELCDDRLRFARGVYVTTRGTVFISGSFSNNIVMFNENRKCLGEMVSSEKMDRGPLAMLFDYKKNCLLVTHINSSSITVVE